MTTQPPDERALTALRVDLRDVPGVMFVATEMGPAGVVIDVAVEDPLRTDAVRRTCEDLIRRHIRGPWSLETAALGAPRRDLTVLRELASDPAVRGVEVTRGPRGELLQVAVEVTGEDAAWAVHQLFDRQVGPRFRRTRLVLSTGTGHGAG